MREIEEGIENFKNAKYVNLHPLCQKDTFMKNVYLSGKYWPFD